MNQKPELNYSDELTHWKELLKVTEYSDEKTKILKKIDTLEKQAAEKAQQEELRKFGQDLGEEPYEQTSKLWRGENV